MQKQKKKNNRKEIVLLYQIILKIAMTSYSRKPFTICFNTYKNVITLRSSCY